jgi:hypothetical protein
MNANGLLGLHGDDLDIAAAMEAIAQWGQQSPRCLDDHELRVGAGRCARCGGPLTRSDDVRRRADREAVHQSCPPLAR